MVKRLFDLLFSLIFLILLSPILIIVGILIKLSSKGPVFYVAKRAGINGTTIKVFKFRSMHITDSRTSKITANNDPRVFKFGAFLRKSKIDELPQLLNVVIGNMSIVGPRPEDISIVENNYGEIGLATLSVKPGVASPGSLFNYTHSHLYLDDEEPEFSYINKLLPIKLGIERVYIEDANIIYDLKVIIRTILTILKISAGIKDFEYPQEFSKAKRLGYF